MEVVNKELQMNKVLVIGLDGATFDLIRPWVEQGKLPNLKKLITEGSSGELESTALPNSGPAWVSCLTGVNPGKHGIYGFALRDNSSSYKLGLVNSTHIHTKTIPEILSEYGKRSVLINVPVTYPPFKINGAIVSGMLTPGLKSKFTYPPCLKGELLYAIPDYVIEVPFYNFSFDNMEGKKKLFQQYMQSIEKRKEAMLYLMEKYNWDFFMVVFSELDRIQHYFWAEMDEGHPLHDKKQSSLVGDSISKIYQKLDEYIGEIINGMDENVQILVVSDHGFGPRSRIFNLNQWLFEEGFLVLKYKYSIIGKLKSALRTNETIFKLATKLWKFAKKLRNLRYKEEIDPGAWRKKKVERNTRDNMINWRKTRAFADEHGIRINLQGREPKGFVKQENECESLRKILIEKLKNLKFPCSHQNVFYKVLSKEEVYDGPFRNNVADIIPFLETGNVLATIPAESVFSNSMVTTGSHKKDGIFIACGKGIKDKNEIKHAKIIDITPTILYSLGIPLTQDMDGNVLDIFKKGFASQRNLKICGSSYRVQKGTSLHDLEERTEIESRLKALGYM